MKVVNLYEFKKLKHPEYIANELTEDELDILNQIEEQKGIMFTEEELLENSILVPEFEGEPF